VHRTVPRAVLRQRYEQINDFEHMLAENGTLIVKFFLHISKGEQRRRLAERLADPDKAWKFSANDLKERALWERYVTAYEKLLSRCSTPHAPWYVIPADHRWHRNVAVASVLVGALEDLGSRYPPPTLSPAQARRLRAALGAG
jgi:polyphosphate kinase 2 (PPK2 family)